LTYYVAGAALMAGVVAESVHWGEIARAGLTQLDKGVPPSIYQPGKQDVFTGYRRRCAAYRQADEPRLSGRGRGWLEQQKVIFLAIASPRRFFAQTSLRSLRLRS
jgi:hypothetical protein